MSDRERDSAPHDDFFRALSVPLLAHELKGPLAVIEAGVATALERAGEGADAARLARTLRRVLRSTRRAQALVDDLLEVGRAEAGQLDRVAFSPAAALLDAVVDAVEAMDAELADRVADQSAESMIATLAAGGVELTVADRARASVDRTGPAQVLADRRQPGPQRAALPSLARRDRARRRRRDGHASPSRTTDRAWRPRIASASSSAGRAAPTPSRAAGRATGWAWRRRGSWRGAWAATSLSPRGPEAGSCSPCRSRAPR